MDVRFRPLPTWPTRPTRVRKKLGGETTYSAVLDRLETELGHLKASGIIIETGHRPEDIRLDGWIRANARVPSHPGVILWFNAKATKNGTPIGHQRHSMDAYTTWQDNLRALVLRLEALRAVDRYGGSEATGEQYKGYTELPPSGGTSSNSSSKGTTGKSSSSSSKSSSSSSSRSTGPSSSRTKTSGPTAGTASENFTRMTYEKMSPKEKAAYLLLKEAGEENISYARVSAIVFQVKGKPDAVKTLWRQAAMRTHPDQGGSDERFIAVQAAWESLNG